MGSVDFLRSEAYVNLNDIAKPFWKRLDNWTRLQSTKELLAEFQRDPAYSGKKGVIAVVGRNLAPSDLRYLNLLGVTEPKQGTWGHPDIGIQFAQWCSPGFALWVSRQIRHLMTYGEVNLHYTEWSANDRIQGHQYNRDDIRDLYGR
jgi:hypothetical protein